MPMTKTARTATSQSGFTVVVMAALFIAFAVVVAAMVERNTVLQQITKRDETRDRMQKLAYAIIDHSVFNNSGNINLYPCPADPTVSSANAVFGTAAVNCHTGSPAASSAGGGASVYTTVFLELGTGDPVIGMVPVLELSAYGISINDAFDSWNNRIMYVVNRKLTIGSTSISQANNPTLTDKRTGGYAIAAPDFILISYGRDRMGAYSRSNNTGTPGVACTTGTTTPYFENCNNDTSFIVAPTYVASGAYTTNDGSYKYNSYFDDILVWHRQ